MLRINTALKRFNELTVSCEDISVFESSEMASSHIMSHLIPVLSVSFQDSGEFCFCSKQAPPQTQLNAMTCALLQT